MFDTLSGKLQRIFKNLRGEGKLTAANMEEALREIRVALLEADVHFKVVKQFIEQVKEKALGEEVLSALSPAQQVVKVVRDELTKMLGSHTSRLRLANEPPTVVLVVGAIQLCHGAEQARRPAGYGRVSTEILFGTTLLTARAARLTLSPATDRRDTPCPSR